jgi:hypothetical protein
MCNAYNHPIDCRCGWGGPGHLGGGGIGKGPVNKPYSSLLIAPTARSYVNPHAKCPVCGAEVFFYASENGGRVFFDELGPPWPKHPCTDKMNTYLRAKVEWFPSNREPAPEKSYAWQRLGWTPFVVSQVVTLPPDFRNCQLTGTYKDEQLVLYVKHRGLSPKAPYLLREVNGVLELSSFQKDIESAGSLTKIRKYCYKSVADLFKAEKPIRKKAIVRKTSANKLFENVRLFGKRKKNKRLARK